MLRFAALPAVVATLLSGLAAQSNTVPGLDGRLEILDNISYWGRRGPAFPGGEVGLSMRNTMCNPGTVNIPWFQAMAENHPKFGFIITRLANDRMEQISDRSYCKHAYTSASTNGACGTCNGIGGTQMGVHCSDTYGASLNASRNRLGPADEINPWLGTWNHVGSYFDQGDPNVGAPGNIDGAMSAINITGDEVKNRVTVKEADLTTPGASYYYGIHLIHEGEALANRWDNIKSRGFVPSWGGSAWNVANSAVGETFGSILQHWPGATLFSASNGNDDGRFYVASKATALGGGAFHYQYAVHNVDNNRGGATLRIPIDANAVASNFTFKDIDSNPLNDWTATRVGNEIVFTAPATNPQNWNTIYNFGFDANYPPGNSSVAIDEARIGPGALFVTIGGIAPSGLSYAQSTTTGTGCGGGNCQMAFYESFAVTGLDLANTQFTLTYDAITGKYTLGPSAVPYVTPAGTALPLTDESTTTVALPFSLPYPGGTTSTLWVCSNGYISPTNANPTSFQPLPNSLLAGAARWAGLWHDFNPTAGTIRADVNATRAIVSYTNVPNFSASGTATFQFQFFPNGTVNVIYQSIANAGNGYLVGWSSGGATDPGSWDISANLASGLSLCTGPVPDVTLSTADRPVLGTSIDLDTTNLPLNTWGVLSILSVTQHSPGIDLASLGMPTCSLYEDLDILSLTTTSGSSSSTSWPVPTGPGLSGLVVMAQSASLSPGINAAGIATSNALLLLLGVN